jgi:hypothetical protein
VRLCVFVFVVQCVAFPILGKFVLCILVLFIHLNDSLFDFFSVAQLKSLIWSYPSTAMRCVPLIAHIYTPQNTSRVSPSPNHCYHCKLSVYRHCLFTDTVSVPTLSVYRHCQCNDTNTRRLLSYRYNYHGHWLLHPGLHGANISAMQWTYKEYFYSSRKTGSAISNIWLLKMYKQLNTKHQLFVKHTKTATCFGFIN